MAITISPLANVLSSKIGDNTTIWQFSVILEGAIIGEGCKIDCQVFIENDVVIGNNVTIKPGVQIWDGITLEDNVFVGPNATFTNDFIPRSKKHLDVFPKTTVKKGASLGANCTILPGLTIGESALVAAGAVVTKKVPDYGLVVGNPAKLVGYLTPDKVRLNLEMQDELGNQYEIKNDKLSLCQ